MSVFTKLTGLLPGSEASRARGAYDRAVDQAFAAWEELDGGAAADVPRRHALLWALADAEKVMAGNYGVGYPGADADSIVLVHEHTALLLEVLASASVPWLGRLERVRARESWEAEFGPILDDISKAAARPEVLAELLTRLSFPVCRLLGVGVAETISRLETAVLRAVLGDGPEAIAEATSR